MTHESKKRVGAVPLVVRCDAKYSGTLQTVLCRAQNERLFNNTMTYTPLGQTHNIGEDNFVNILRQHNEFAARTKAVSLFDVDKKVVGRVLRRLTSGVSRFQFLHDVNLITEVEAVFDHEIVWFMGPRIDDVKECLRTYIIPELERLGCTTAHMGRQQAEDVPQEVPTTMINDAKASFKDYQDYPDAPKPFIQPSRRLRTPKISYANMVTPEKRSPS